MRIVRSRPGWVRALPVVGVVALGVFALGAARGLASEPPVDSPLAGSSVVSADALQAHGVPLVPVPDGASAPRVTAEDARSIAKAVTKASTDPKETFRVLARPTADAAERSAWLLIFEGGRHGGSLGPPDGVATRTFATEYTGVLIDDQSGEVLYWFQGGTFTP